MTQFRHIGSLLTPALVVAIVSPIGALKAPQPHRPASQVHHSPSHANQTVGHGQLAGGNGQFGVVYSLKNGFNFEILSARYTMEPFVAYHSVAPRTAEKLLVVDFAIKNATASDNWLNTEDFITFVDSAGQLYRTSNVALASQGTKSLNMSLRPGQGYGQPGLKDTLSTVVAVPGDARIVKFMLRYGRVTPKEDTFRYYIAGATKEEAGEAGNPKNVIAPLPDTARDPKDPSGATALPVGKGVAGEPVPSGLFHLTLHGLTYTTDSPVGQEVRAGKRFAIATVTAKLMMDYDWGGKPSMFDLSPDEALQITDADGERYHPSIPGWGAPYLKATRPEQAEHRFEGGDEYAYRIAFEMPKDAAAKTLVLAARDGRKWEFDVSGAK